MAAADTGAKELYPAHVLIEGSDFRDYMGGFRVASKLTADNALTAGEYYPDYRGPEINHLGVVCVGTSDPEVVQGRPMNPAELLAAVAVGSCTPEELGLGEEEADKLAVAAGHFASLAGVMGYNLPEPGGNGQEAQHPGIDHVGAGKADAAESVGVAVVHEVTASPGAITAAPASEAEAGDVAETTGVGLETLAMDGFIDSEIDHEDLGVEDLAYLREVAKRRGLNSWFRGLSAQSARSLFAQV